jgi:hypothetical protein
MSQSVSPQMKQQIGDFIYPHILQKFGELASRITGVLLDSS